VSRQVQSAPTAARTLNVLLTQAGARAGCTIARRLTRAGARVYCADATPWIAARVSRSNHGFRRYPSPHVDAEGYFAVVNRCLRDWDIDVVIPGYDEALFLAAQRHRLQRPHALRLPPAASFRQLHHKPSFYALCHALAIPAPTTVTLDVPDDLAHAASLGFPLMLKPERGGGGWAVRRVDTAAELASAWYAFDGVGHDNRLFAQAYIAGDLIGHGMVCREGQVIACDTYRIERQFPLATGTATCRTAIDDPAVADIAARIVAAVAWTGPCHFDFLVEPATGRRLVIDCNPRFWGSLAHGVARGIDYPALWLAIAAGGEPEVPVPASVAAETPLRSIWFGGDLLGLITGLRDEGAVAGPVGARLRDWASARLDGWSWRDPLPFLVYPLVKWLNRGVPTNGF